jgi:hypothetical protein
VIRTMGVSVKEGDSPIGYFGTGLKFAIASLLRTGHTVRLFREGKLIDFDAEPTVIRGEQFNVVTMNGERLGFTTQLGKNWTPDMAYRELHSNCLDEGGMISDWMPKNPGGTLFIIGGDGIERAYAERDTMFLSGEPVAKLHRVEAFPGSSKYGFYRGVRALNLEQAAIFSWSVTADLELTEDRTIKNAYSFMSHVRSAIAQSTDRDLLERVLLTPRDSFEGSLDFEHTYMPGSVFMEVCGKYRTDLRLNQSAYRLWVKQAPPTQLPETKTTPLIEKDITEALGLLKHLGCAMTRDDFKVVESLGDGIFGCVRSGEIMISMKTMDRGPRFIASTLYEEWVHKTMGLRDESRALQDHLLDRLMRFVAEFDSMVDSHPKGSGTLC